MADGFGAGEAWVCGEGTEMAVAGDACGVGATTGLGSGVDDGWGGGVEDGRGWVTGGVVGVVDGLGGFVCECALVKTSVIRTTTMGARLNHARPPAPDFSLGE